MCINFVSYLYFVHLARGVKTFEDCRILDASELKETFLLSKLEELILDEASF